MVYIDIKVDALALSFVGGLPRGGLPVAKDVKRL